MIGRLDRQGDLFPLIVSMLGGSALDAGPDGESGDVLDGALEAARLSDNVARDSPCTSSTARFAAFAAGDIDLALSTAEESFDLSQQLDEGPVTAHAASPSLRSLCETSQPARCS